METQFKVYIDSSLALDYYLATGGEHPDDYFIDTRSEYDKEEETLWAELLKNNKRLARAKKLRSIISWGHPTATLVISPLVLLEMQAWIAADTIKRGVLTSTHIKAMQRLSIKEVGDLAKQLWESDARRIKGVRRDWAYAMFTSPVGEGLIGIQIEDIPSLRLNENIFKKLITMAVYQVGLADIIHLLAARRLKCTHFATTDSDFQRIRNIIAKDFGMTLLLNNEVFSVVKPQVLPAKPSGRRGNPRASVPPQA